MSEIYLCRCKRDGNLQLINNETELSDSLQVKTGNRFDYYKLNEHYVIEDTYNDEIYWISNDDRDKFFEPMPITRTQIETFMTTELCNEFLRTIEPDTIKDVKRSADGYYTVVYDRTIIRTWAETLMN